MVVFLACLVLSGHCLGWTDCRRNFIVRSTPDLLPKHYKFMCLLLVSKGLWFGVTHINVYLNEILKNLRVLWNTDFISLLLLFLNTTYRYFCSYFPTSRCFFDLFLCLKTKNSVFLLSSYYFTKRLGWTMLKRVFLLHNFNSFNSFFSSFNVHCDVLEGSCIVSQTWSWVFLQYTVLWNILWKELNSCSRKDLTLFQNLHIAQFHDRHLLSDYWLNGWDWWTEA